MLKRNFFLSALLALMFLAGQLAPASAIAENANAEQGEMAKDEMSKGEMAKAETKADDAMADAWAPEQPLGSSLPDFTALDSSGAEVTLGSLTGEEGILLVLSRSADW